MILADLEKEVRNLSPDEFSAFTRWLDGYMSSQWETQFENDVAAGKLEAVGRKADRAFEAGECREL